MPAIRPIPFQILVRIFEREGFQFDRWEGDLRRTSGMRRERYFELLRE